MNVKQIVVIFICLITLILIFLLTPKYKILWIDSENFIRTEASSTLYERSHGKEELHWDTILPAAGGTVLVSLLLILMLREKKDDVAK